MWCANLCVNTSMDRYYMGWNPTRMQLRWMNGSTLWAFGCSGTSSEFLGTAEIQGPKKLEDWVGENLHLGNLWTSQISQLPLCKPQPCGMMFLNLLFIRVPLAYLLGPLPSLIVSQHANIYIIFICTPCKYPGAHTGPLGYVWEVLVWRHFLFFLRRQWPTCSTGLHAILAHSIIILFHSFLWSFDPDGEDSGITLLKYDLGSNSDWDT